MSTNKIALFEIQYIYLYLYLLMPDKLNRFGAARLTGQTTFIMTAKEVEVAWVDNSQKMHHNERGKNVNKFVTATQPFLLST